MLNQKLLQDPEVQDIVIEAMRYYKRAATEDIAHESGNFIRANTKPPVILKTEDGVDVTDENIAVYWLVATTFRGSAMKARDCDSKFGYKYFSTPEARDEYILWNKPLLSGEDVKKYVQLISDNDKNRLTALLKSKIK